MWGKFVKNLISFKPKGLNSSLNTYCKIVFEKFLPLNSSLILNRISKKNGQTLQKHCLYFFLVYIKQ